MKRQQQWLCMRTSTVLKSPYTLMSQRNLNRLKMDLFARCIMGLRGVLKVVFKLMSTDNTRKYIYSNGKFLMKSFNIFYFRNFINLIAFWLWSGELMLLNSKPFHTVFTISMVLIWPLCSLTAAGCYVLFTVVKKRRVNILHNVFLLCPTEERKA